MSTINIDYMLKLHDLQQQGLSLSKSDAMVLHSPINEISQRGGDNEIVFPGNGETVAPKEDPLKIYYAEIRERNSNLLKENRDLKLENDALKAQLAEKTETETGKKADAEEDDLEDPQDQPDETKDLPDEKPTETVKVKKENTKPAKVGKPKPAKA